MDKQDIYPGFLARSNKSVLSVEYLELNLFLYLVPSTNRYNA